MIRLTLALTLALLSGNAFAYLSESQQELLKSKQCQPHQQDPEYTESLELAYALEFCANLVRLRDNDYKRGWELHKWATVLTKELPCSCTLHTHADNLAYGVYIEVSEILNNGTPISDKIEDFCDEVQMEFKPLAKEKGTE